MSKIFHSGPKSAFRMPTISARQAGSGGDVSVRRDAGREGGQQRQLQRRGRGGGGSLVPLSADVLLPAPVDRVSQMMRDFTREMDDMMRTLGVVGSSGGLFPSVFDTTPSVYDDTATALRAFANVDVQETDKEYRFTVDLPGLSKDDIKISVDQHNVLTMSGERKKEEEEGDEKSGYRRAERVYGRFVRRFQLPDNADTEHIKAKIEHGVLNLSVPKKEPEPEHVKEIPIEAGDSGGAGSTRAADAGSTTASTRPDV